MSDKTKLLPLMNEMWLDVNDGLEKSGSIEEYLKLLEIFYNDIETKAALIDSYYSQNNITDYTIKVHALKSSARLIGATDFGEEAWQLEEAGKKGDLDYINSHHRAFVNELLSFKEPLSALFSSPDDTSDEDTKKPVASDALMEQVLRKMSVAADDMDCDAIDDVISRMQGYRIPDSHADLWKKLMAYADEYEYEEIYRLTSFR